MKPLKSILLSFILSLVVHGMVLAMAVGWSGLGARNNPPADGVVFVELLQAKAPEPQSAPVQDPVAVAPPIPPKSRPVTKSRPKPKVLCEKPAEPPAEEPPGRPEEAQMAAVDIVGPSEGGGGGITMAVSPDQNPVESAPAVGYAGEKKEEVQEAVPLYDVNPSPPYPAAARQRGYQGTVIVEALVRASGAVADVLLFQSSGYPLLDQAALRAVKDWIFRPGTRGGREVDMAVHVPVVFQLH